MLVSEISIWGAALVALFVLIAAIALAFIDKKMLRRMLVIFGATIAQMVVVVAEHKIHGPTFSGGHPDVVCRHAVRRCFGTCQPDSRHPAGCCRLRGQRVIGRGGAGDAFARGLEHAVAPLIIVINNVGFCVSLPKI